MSAKGFALCSYSWGRYVFEECGKNEYIYWIELLQNSLSKPESMAYLGSLEETGIVRVTTYLRWLSLWKRSADGPFDLYTDIDSQLDHYRTVTNLWNVLASLRCWHPS